jgi:hypothetical protein
MPWSFKFPSPIELNDGRRVATLDDVRVLIFSLPDDRLANPKLHSVARLLDDASRDWMLVGEAGIQVRDAFKAEGLI